MTENESNIRSSLLKVDQELVSEDFYILCNRYYMNDQTVSDSLRIVL